MKPSRIGTHLFVHLGPIVPIASPSPDGLTLRAFSKAPSCFPAFDVVVNFFIFFLPLRLCATAGELGLQDFSPAPAQFILHHSDFILSPQGDGFFVCYAGEGYRNLISQGSVT